MNDIVSDDAEDNHAGVDDDDKMIQWSELLWYEVIDIWSDMLSIPYHITSHIASILWYDMMVQYYVIWCDNGNVNGNVM